MCTSRDNEWAAGESFSISCYRYCVVLYISDFMEKLDSIIMYFNISALIQVVYIIYIISDILIQLRQRMQRHNILPLTGRLTSFCHSCKNTII